jgi:tRNA nucleotidyltransferase (CCA-adding enzyme)
MKSNSELGQEFYTLIQEGKGAGYLLDLKKKNTLGELYPELAKCIDIGKKSIHHKEDVFTHLVLSLVHAEGQKYSMEVRFAALLHDIGKPDTIQEAKVGVTFHGHELVGATIAYSLLSRLGYNKQFIERVVLLIRHHMYRFDELTRDTTLRHWLYKLGPRWLEVIQVRACDRRGNLAKVGKPAWTTEMFDLEKRCEDIIKLGPVFREDIHIDNGIVESLSDNPEGVYLSLLGIIRQHPERNNPEYLIPYINRVCSNDPNPAPSNL